MLNIRQDLEQSIRAKVDSGAFSSADAVLEHALSLLDDQHNWLERNREALEQSLSAAQRQPAEPLSDADWQYLRSQIKKP